MSISGALLVIAIFSAPIAHVPNSTTHYVAIGNPFHDADAHTSHYSILPAAIGYVFGTFAHSYPGVNSSFAYRLLELAVVVGIEVQWMTYSHEVGHFRVGARYNWNPRIRMSGWASGSTRYRYSSRRSQTSWQRNEANAAGVNQEIFNSIYMYRNWALNNDARYTEALGYLFAQTNLALYAANSFYNSKNTSHRDDIAKYTYHLRQNGIDIETSEIMTTSVIANMLSVSLWAAMIGSVKFLLTGDRRIGVPVISIGSAKITYPNFHVLLGVRGPIVGGTIFIKPSNGPSLELRADVSSDETTWAGSMRLHGVSVTDRLNLSPHAAVSYSANHSLGYVAGVNLNVSLSRCIGAMIGATYGSDFVFDKVRGHKDGFLVKGGLTLRF